MIPWTPSAREELNRYLTRVRRSLETSGADTAEVIEDIRRHIDVEVAAAKLHAVAEQDVRRILSRIGAPEANTESKPAPAHNPAVPSSVPVRPGGKSPGVALIVFGVVLPVIALGMELGTNMCAAAFFDPMPTVWHTLLVAFVPLVNILAWEGARSGRGEFRTRLAWANAIALGVTVCYALRFLALLPAAAVAVFFFGWGLLPMSPLLAFFSTLRLRHHLRSLGEDRTPLPGLWSGLAIGMVAMLALEAPVVITRIGLQMATSGEPGTQASGVKWLRAVGHEETLLRACYGRTRGAANMDPIHWILDGDKPVWPEQARTIFYRVTGQAFNSVPAPRVRTGRGAWAGLNDFTWDNDQGGDKVAGRVKGLSLAGSRIDGVIHADAALSYLEWTLAFKNVSDQQREARAQVALPPGAVVSRLTLWINGEEREAAFGGRGQVRQAYQSVVQQRRDPVLVTTCGPDRILLQCFPVPSGGTMKVRVGITAPLVLAGAGEGFLRWPCFLERNFTIPVEFKHTLWVESSQALDGKSLELKREQSTNGLVTVRGELTDRNLADPLNTVRAMRRGEVVTVWTADSRDEKGRIVRQTMRETEQSLPGRVVFVVDGSQRMSEHFSAIADAVAQLPDGLEFTVLLAGDEVAELSDSARKGNKETFRAAADRLRRSTSGGGQDNVPALIRAWDNAAERQSGLIIWIHGPQPILFENAEQLRQRFERRPGSPVLQELQTDAGPNRVVENLDGLGAVKSIPRLSTVAEDMKRLVDGWSLSAKGIELVRERVTSDLPETAQPGKKTTSHLARLWAHEEVLRLIASRKTDDAMRLAGRFQLVTPVSGAVVLETKQQYTVAGLQPVDAATVPTIPEPSTWVLLIVGLLTAGPLLRRQRRQRV